MKKITYKTTGINVSYGEIEHENETLIIFKPNTGGYLVIKKKSIIGKIENV